MRRATTSRSVVGQLCLLAAITAAFLSVATPAAQADAPIGTFSITPSTTQAGGHPDITTLFTVGNAIPKAFPRRIAAARTPRKSPSTPRPVSSPIHTLPPSAPPLSLLRYKCPIDSQVGVARVGIFTEKPNEVSGNPAPQDPYNYVALYNLVPHSDEAGLVGFNIPTFGLPIFLVVGSRTESDYGLKLTITGVTQFAPLAFSETTFWGVPADSIHDEQRFSPVGCNPTATGERIAREGCNFKPNPSNSPAIPFNDSPTTCGVPLEASLHVLSYDNGISEANTPYPATTGCDQLSFNPSLFAQPTTAATDSASGLALNLQVPQESSPSVPSPSEIKEATVTLPEGFSINPNAADGKTVCTEAEARFGTEEEAHCPESSKVGSLTIESAALPGPLPGYIYLGEPKPGNRYRIFLVANGFNVHVKLAGSVTPNPLTGQIVTSFNGSTPNFEGLPQSPFSDLDLHFFGSERGLLATPTKCGTYPVQSTFTPWDSFLPKQTSTQYFELKSGPITLETGPGGAACPGSTRPFQPGLSCGSWVSNTTAAHTPFSLELTRPDGDQNLSGLTVTTPPGLSATLAGVPYCPEAEIDAAAQPGYSGLEEEAHPAVLRPPLSAPPRWEPAPAPTPSTCRARSTSPAPTRAPHFLSLITPAVSGPYDLGNAVVRAALHVNPETAQITAVSDPLPRILEGIPLRLRSILIELNRPGFTLNPTNCDPFSVSATVSGEEGAQANLSTPFQVADCSGLPFAPKLALKLSGSTKRAGNPALTATLTANPGEANIASTALTMPPTEIVDNAHISTPCTKVQFAEGKVPGEKCPPGSVIGFAKAKTPILEAPLEGPVYLRTHPGAGLPDIVAALNGQIDIDLDGRIDTVAEKVHGERVSRIRTTFQTVPDAPVSSFTLALDGGGKGLLQNDTSLCGHSLRANLKMAGQNGKELDQNPLLQTPCGKAKGKGKGGRAHRNRRGG